MLNLGTIFSDIFKLIPYVMAGVEVVHQGESSETKLQLAQDALSVATQGAAQVLAPGDQAIAQNVSGLVSAGLAIAQQATQKQIAQASQVAKVATSQVVLHPQAVAESAPASHTQTESQSSQLLPTEEPAVRRSPYGG